MNDAALELDGSTLGLTLITGPNGSGKSSVARALAESVEGAERLSAESQQAFYEAQLAADESDFREAVDLGSTVRELLGADGLRHPLFGAFRLQPLCDRGYRALSTGEGRKVLLIRAVLSRPPLLVLDDPFEGLDRAACAELAEAIVQVARELRVVVAGTFGAHDLPWPADAISEVIVVAGGQPVFRGTAADFATRVTSLTSPRPAPPVGLGSYYEPLDSEQPLVELVQGHVRYGEQTVFERLDFRVARGQHTLIEGPNGSGKTSLLELLTGDHPQAYANDLHLFGRRRGTGETVWEIKQNIGLVSSRLHRDYRVGGSVEAALLSGLYDSIGVYRRPEPSHRARARAWLAWLDLGLSPEAPFNELSFGQQRLVLIARAAIKLPPLLVLDEPTTGLDAENRTRALQLVESLCSQQRSTVIMVTHRADERAFWQERIGGAILSLG
jgi:molybdate transport system ATP-binding protein